MFAKVLIANRGEIALRVIRACRELGCKTVAVFSEADRHSLHPRMADEAYCIGPPQSARSYLNIPNIISAAEIANVDAIHPGYGFLSENAQFAEICASHGFKFIGPGVDSIGLMGDKASAKHRMAEANVPVIPGSDVVESEGDAIRFCRDVGYPVLIKATAGGGGKGMRIVGREADLTAGLAAASSEAQAAFNDGRVYVEKLLVHPRHIEVQVLGDEFGHVIHLGERDCSVQKPSHQKLLEEAPAPNLDPAVRAELLATAVKAARAVDYANAGTLEFLLNEDGKFYFLEMNTRIQVEHPVTEVVFGIDLVKWQVRIAAGERLSVRQEEVQANGHAIECRINAEDAENSFRPAAGKLGSVLFPGGPGIRVDSHIYTGAEVPPYYDSMLAKIVAHDRTRGDAVLRMRRALAETEILGVATTVPIHERILATSSFVEGRTFVTWLREHVLQSHRPVGAALGG
ncbi:MAG: acetyl-CoA carboxylase biotin carboxylase subunit [Candidatus Eremiobacter antarcticus]|nr:acetyl-CoA carboxylase biotin carboxylase subunit [Candidatus Eremiobacteraeota bacterium]MBC5807437.1 acetyl-CoA carboxylase biotin carboxylase subunit [Candidatus Eremiobacteraeota bacterium]PZR63177.1 MAG: acetyl-CoA carboxylase biotin carboxylase subunit [Candidatus Eremiobacter sp. RRmetagenome_bin22]